MSKAAKVWSFVDNGGNIADGEVMKVELPLANDDDTVPVTDTTYIDHLFCNLLERVVKFVKESQSMSKPRAFLIKLPKFPTLRLWMSLIRELLLSKGFTVNGKELLISEPPTKDVTVLEFWADDVIRACGPGQTIVVPIYSDNDYNWSLLDRFGPVHMCSLTYGDHRFKPISAQPMSFALFEIIIESDPQFEILRQKYSSNLLYNSCGGVLSYLTDSIDVSAAMQYRLMMELHGSSLVGIEREADVFEACTIKMPTGRLAGSVWLITSHPFSGSQLHPYNTDDCPVADGQTIIAPRRRITDAAPLTMTNLVLPSFCAYMSAQYVQDGRWPLATVQGVRVIPSTLLFTTTARVLIKLVQTVQQSPKNHRSKSWHVTGMLGTGKSISMLLCSAVWFAFKSKYRLAYVPNSSPAGISVAKVIWRMLCHAFHADPILPLIANYDSLLGTANGLQDLMQRIDEYLGMKSLLLVIVIDQLNAATTDSTRDLDLLDQLRHLCHSGNLCNVLLITAASMNNDNVDPDNCTVVDILTGINQKEARNILENQGLDNDRITASLSVLGHRPIDLDYQVDPITAKYSHMSGNPAGYNHLERSLKISKRITEKFAAFCAENVTESDDRQEYLSTMVQRRLLPNVNKRLVDRRFVRVVPCPKHWIPALLDGIEDDGQLCAVMEECRWLPEGTFHGLLFTDILDYEKRICQTSFLHLLSKSNPVVYALIPANQLVRETLAAIALQRTIKQIDHSIASPSIPRALLGYQLESTFARDFAAASSKMYVVAYELAFNVHGKVTKARKQNLDLGGPCQIFNERGILSSLLVDNRNSAKLGERIDIPSQFHNRLYVLPPGQRHIDFMLVVKSNNGPKAAAIQLTMQSTSSIVMYKLVDSSIGFYETAKSDFPVLFSVLDSSEYQRIGPLNLLFVSATDPFAGPNFHTFNTRPGSQISDAVVRLAGLERELRVYLVVLDSENAANFPASVMHVRSMREYI